MVVQNDRTDRFLFPPKTLPEVQAMKKEPPCAGCGEPVPAPGELCACKKPRRVVCAANRSKVTGQIICGARHWDHIMRQQVQWLENQPDGRKMPHEWSGAEQGFIDQFGRFLTRQEAFLIAQSQNQILYPGFDTGTLYSEDLY
jgi:hypothetical protein